MGNGLVPGMEWLLLICVLMANRCVGAAGYVCDWYD